MAPEGERELVVDSCQDCDEMRFEGLDGALCLVASVIAGGDQFELYLLLADVLLECICARYPLPLLAERLSKQAMRTVKH